MLPTVPDPATVGCDQDSARGADRAGTGPGISVGLQLAAAAGVCGSGDGDGQDMNFPAQFASAAKPTTEKTCVRWNPKTRRYELVVNGHVLHSISKLRMSMRSERMKFRAMVAATASAVSRVKRADAEEEGSHG